MDFEIKFFGHENIRSNHQKTIEITRERDLTPSGDCIVGVGASAGCADLPEQLKEDLRDESSTILITLCVGRYRFEVRGRGHDALELTHKDDIVIRKSGFVCPRTMAVRCDKASDMLPREMVSLLRNPETVGVMAIRTGKCDSFI